MPWSGARTATVPGGAGRSARAGARGAGALAGGAADLPCASTASGSPRIDAPAGGLALGACAAARGTAAVVAARAAATSSAAFSSTKRVVTRCSRERGMAQQREQEAAVGLDPLDPELGERALGAREQSAKRGEGECTITFASSESKRGLLA